MKGGEIFTVLAGHAARRKRDSGAHCEHRKVDALLKVAVIRRGWNGGRLFHIIIWRWMEMEIETGSSMLFTDTSLSI